MPTYEYECLECRHRFEVFQNIKDNPVAECVKCKGRVRRLIGAGAGIIFKGSGFYVTDYKKGQASGGGNGKAGKDSPSGEKAKSDPPAKTATDSTAN
ncbi:MAG: zinc ribbon domain-containing protein [Spirochaetes bacterium]|jgi:putative FmdB family regulatory protein|nr:zinc ribbon domain-containing protein [Spirochaetota bacterium]